MKLEPKVRVPNARCPSCKTLVDGATGTTGAAKPVAGDVTVCIFCASVSQYDADMQLQPYDVAQLHPEDRAHVEKLRATVRKVHGA